LIASKLIGGAKALALLGGREIENMSDTLKLREVRIETSGDDVVIREII
jgi:riboflavin biosynthesis pyrimidine reductase